jgi:hypothetical protein
MWISGRDWRRLFADGWAEYVYLVRAVGAGDGSKNDDVWCMIGHVGKHIAWETYESHNPSFANGTEENGVRLLLLDGWNPEERGRAETASSSYQAGAKILVPHTGGKL